MQYFSCCIGGIGPISLDRHDRGLFYADVATNVHFESKKLGNREAKETGVGNYPTAQLYLRHIQT